MLREMGEKQLEVTLISCSAALGACEKGQQWEAALELLREMVVQGLTLDVVSYNAAISACEKRRLEPE